MRTPPFCRRWSLVGLIAISAPLGAQTPSPTPPPSAPEATPEQATARKPRAISPELAAALAAGVKYEAPAGQKKGTEPPPDFDEADVVDASELTEERDLREVDRPRNTIIRLPKYIVEGDRPPVFRERDIHTEKGLADLAIKRYLSSAHQTLNRYHLPAILGGVSNEQLAMTMYREQERLNNMREFDDKVYLYRSTGDEKAANELKDDADSTFIRRTEFSEAPRSNGR